MTAGFADSALSRDGFLGGRLEVLQPRRGYRAGADPVLLAAAVDARPGQRVLELGCGAGVAALCLGRRVAGLALCGVELQPDYAALARRNARLNRLALEVVCADLRALPDHVRARSFDHVMANPPYFAPERRSTAADAGRETALAGPTPLAEWIGTAARRLAPGGRLTVILHTAQLGALLGALDERLGSVVIKPLAARPGRDAGRLIVSARKGGRAGLRLLAPLILHAGPRHRADGDDHTPEAQAILRDGAPLKIHD